MKEEISLSLQHLAWKRSTTTFWNYRNHEASLWPSISVTVQESLERQRHPLIFGKVSCFLYRENCHIVVGIKYNTSWSCDFLVCYKMSPGQLTCFCIFCLEQLATYDIQIEWLLIPQAILEKRAITDAWNSSQRCVGAGGHWKRCSSHLEFHWYRLNIAPVSLATYWCSSATILQ